MYRTKCNWTKNRERAEWSPFSGNRMVEESLSDEENRRHYSLLRLNPCESCIKLQFIVGDLKRSTFGIEVISNLALGMWVQWERTRYSECRLFAHRPAFFFLAFLKKYVNRIYVVGTFFILRFLKEHHNPINAVGTFFYCVL